MSDCSFSDPRTAGPGRCGKIETPLLRFTVASDSNYELYDKKAQVRVAE